MKTSRDEINPGDFVVALDNYYSEIDGKNHFTKGKTYEVFQVSSVKNAPHSKVTVSQDDLGMLNSWEYSKFQKLEEYKIADKERERLFEWLTAPKTVTKAEEPETQFKTKNDAEFSIFPDDENPEDIRIEISPDYVWNKEDVWELVAELLEKVGNIDKEGNILDKKDTDLAQLNSVDAGNLTAEKISLADGSASIDFKEGKFILLAEPFIFTDNKIKINKTLENKNMEQTNTNLISLETELSLLNSWVRAELSSLVSQVTLLSNQVNNLQNKEFEPKKPKQLLILTAPGSVSDETHDRLKEDLRETLKNANIDAEPLVLSDGLHAYFAQS